MRKIQAPLGGEGDQQIQEDEESFSVVPNPASNTLNMITPTGLWQWEIYNTQGKLILSGRGSVIDISSLPSGAYFVRSKGKHSLFLKE